MFSKLNTLIDAICKEKGVKKDLVIDSLENAFVSVVKKRLGELGSIANLSAQYTAEDDSVAVFQYKTVVDDFNENKEPRVLSEVEAINNILHSEAVKSDVDVEVGDELGFLLDSTFTTLNRKNIQMFKQILMQRIKDAERKTLMDNFSDKKGKIVSGIVKMIDSKGNALVDLGSAEARLYKRDMLIGDELSQNSKVRALLVDVKRGGSGGVEIILSRNSHMFLVKKLEEECPRVEDGTIEIVKISREGGLRSKVVVKSHDSSVNPISEILGDSGYRIQSIIEDFEGEKINIILDTNDRSELLVNCLKPGMIESYTEYDDKINVVADSEELGKLIGKKGSNLRSAASIMGKRINLITVENLSNMKSASREELNSIKSLSELSKEKLINANIFSVKALSQELTENLSSYLELTEEESNEILNEAKVLLDDTSFVPKTDEFSLVESYGKPKEFLLPEKEVTESVGAEQRLREELRAFKLQ
jgi:N utilization substance protein A